MKIEDYRCSHQDKFESYLNEGFAQEQLEIPLRKMLLSLNSIIDRYKNKYKVEKWHKVASSVKKCFDGKKTDKKNDYLYQQVRVFLEKDLSEIDNLKYTLTLPNRQNRDQYAAILSEIAETCIHDCIEEFKNDAQLMKSLQKNLAQKTPKEIQKKYDLVPNRAKPMDIERLERLENANSKWQEYYLSKEEVSFTFTEKSKHVHFFTNSDEENTYNSEPIQNLTCNSL